jgi:hypothetical protein
MLFAGVVRMASTHVLQKPGPDWSITQAQEG